MMRMLALAGAAVLLSACGFHLRGHLDLPPVMQSTYIDYRGQDAGLLRAVSRALALSDVAVQRRPETATAILRIVSARTAQRVLSKDSSGRPREYEVVVRLVYTVTLPPDESVPAAGVAGDATEEMTEDGAPLPPAATVVVPVQSVERRSNVVLDPAEPLANAGDVARAVESLREETVRDMLARIAAAARAGEAVE